MSFWTLNNFKEITSGHILHRPVDNKNVIFKGVSTDTRTIKPGEVFVALRGENFNGHDYIAQAVEKKAALVVVDNDAMTKKIEFGDTSVLLVTDTLKVLSTLATVYRRTLNAKVIAITGSVGKTTTKSILEAVLSQKYQGTVSPRSYNNAIGVPLTILAAKSSDAYIIAEVGTNAPGEIGFLSKIVQPDIAVITSVGRAHMEGLGSLGDIAREKASILSHLTDNGLAVINGDYDILRDYYKLAPTVITFGERDENDLRVTDCEHTPTGVIFMVNSRKQFNLSLLGRHNAVNALAAIAVARSMQMNDEDIATGLEKVSPPDMRMNFKRLGHQSQTIHLINDAYNANPESVKAAIDVLCEIQTPGRKLIILGDMAELGDVSADMHRQVGQYLAESNVDHAILLGVMSTYIGEALSRHWPDNKYLVVPDYLGSRAAEIAEMIKPGDVVLIKASRSMEFENLALAIEDRFNKVAT